MTRDPAGLAGTGSGGGRRVVSNNGGGFGSLHFKATRVHFNKQSSVKH